MGSVWPLYNDAYRRRVTTREVTATLPHADWLLEAHLSDGSVMTVTEDHRFWSVTDNGWVELQDLDTTDLLLTPDGATVTVDWLDWDAGADAPAWDLTVQAEHNFFVAADATAEPVLVHNQTPGFFCGVPVDDPEVAADLVDLNRRLDDTGDSDAVGSALTRLSENLADEGLDAAGVDRILNVIVDVERRGDTDLAETMARNLAADSRATEGIVRRELDLAANGSANAGVYSESVLGDSDYAAIWAMAAGRQDQVLVRIDDPDFWSFESDVTNLAELRIRDYLVADGRSVDNFPLEPVPGRRDPDALVDGVKTDFKSLSETGGENALYNNVRNSLQSPQGPNLVVDARTNAGDGVGREFARLEIERALDEATAVGLARVDVLLDDDTPLTWVQGTGFLP